MPELAEALHSDPARRLVALNLAPQPGETDGFSPQKHLEVLRPARARPGSTWCSPTPGVVDDRDELEKAAAELGGRLRPGRRRGRRRLAAA